MQNIDIYQAGNYFQYTASILNNGNPSTERDRIVSIDTTQIQTQKGLTISTELADKQFQPIPLCESCLTEIGFEKHCPEENFSIWQMTCGTPDAKPVTVTIIEHNENKAFYLSFVNIPIYVHSLQNLLYNITGTIIDLPIKL